MSSINQLIEYAASNSIQVLNHAGISLSKMKFAGIRIPEANLNKAMLSGTDLTGADLTGVNLTSAFMKDCKISKAKMTDV